MHSYERKINCNTAPGPQVAGNFVRPTSHFFLCFFFPKKVLTPNKYLATQSVFTSASGEHRLYQERLKEQVVRWSLELDYLLPTLANKDSITEAQTISVTNFHWQWIEKVAL